VAHYTRTYGHCVSACRLFVFLMWTCVMCREMWYLFNVNENKGLTIYELEKGVVQMTQTEDIFDRYWWCTCLFHCSLKGCQNPFCRIHSYQTIVSTWTKTVLATQNSILYFACTSLAKISFADCTAMSIHQDRCQK